MKLEESVSWAMINQGYQVKDYFRIVSGRKQWFFSEASNICINEQLVKIIEELEKVRFNDEI